MADINKLSVEIITTWDLTEKHKQSWQKLAANHYNPNVFFTLDWLTLWWDVFAQKNDRLHVIFISIADNIVGICPFYFQGDTTLRFIGTGEPEISEVCSEYLDVLIERSNQSIVLDVITQQLSGIMGGINKFEFNNVLKGSHILAVANKLKKQCFINKRCVGLRYSANLPKSYREFTESLSKSFMTQMRRKQRKLSKLKGQFVEVNSENELNLYLQHLQQLHCARWNKKGLQGAFSEKTFIHFHHKFTRVLLAKNLLSMKVLIIDDEIHGVIYNMVYCGARFFYQIGINLDYKENLSIGTQLHLEEIRTAIAKNDNIYDFMKGKITNSYKQNFTNQTTEMFDIVLINKLHLKSIFKLLFSRFRCKWF